MNPLNFFQSLGVNHHNFFNYAYYKLKKIQIKHKLHTLLIPSCHHEQELQHQLDKILHYCIKYVPYYQGKHYQTLTDFPVIGKTDFLARKDQFLSTKIASFPYRTATTGGSTGEPFGFLISPQYDDIHQEFLWRYMGYQDGDKILGMGGLKVSKEDLQKNIYWKKCSDKQLPYAGYRLSSIYLNHNTFPYYYDYINQLQPSFIRGYVSAVYSVAKWMDEQSLTLSYQIKGIELTSESVFEYQIALIEKVFHTKVFLQYGHTEACIFAYSYDSTHKYKCSPFYGYVEVLNEQNEQVREGETGEVVVTSFTNFAQPFIRYRTGDLAEYGGTENGIVTLNKVYGRTQDFVYNGKKEQSLLTAIIFGLHYSAFNHIIRWQIEQFEYGVIQFHIIPSESFTSGDEEEIRKTFREQADIEAQFTYVKELPVTPRGKSKLLIQHL